MASGEQHKQEPGQDPGPWEEQSSSPEQEIQDNVRQARRKGQQMSAQSDNTKAPSEPPQGEGEPGPSGAASPKVSHEEATASSEASKPLKPSEKARQAQNPTAGGGGGGALRPPAGHGGGRRWGRMVARFFYRSLVAVLFLFHIIFAATYLVLSPEFVEEQAEKQFNAMSHGTLSLKVKKINPLTGIWIEDLEIKNGPEFDGSTFVKIKRLKVSYALPAFLWLNIHVPEVGLYSPHIYLKQRDGVWNFARLMKEGDKKPEEKEKKEEKKEEPSGEAQDKIELPLSLRVLFRFVLDDFRLYVDAQGQKPENNFSAGLEGFGVDAEVLVPPTKEIPINPPTEVFSIFRKLSVEINRDKPLQVWYKAESMESKPPLFMHFKAFLDKDKNSFNSKLKMGVVKAPVRVKKKILAPFDFLVEHDIMYHPDKDRLDMNYFQVIFKKQKWLRLEGSIANVQKKPKLDIRMTESNILLNELYPYYVSLTGDRSIYFAGKIALKPLTIKGTPEDLKVDGAVNMYRIRARVPGLKGIYLSRLHLDYHTRLAGKPAEPKYFRINNLYAYVNGAALRGRVRVPLRNNMPAGRVYAKITLNNLRPERFVSAGAKGPVNFSLVSRSRRGLRDLTTKIRVNLNRFVYTLDNSQSRPMYIKVFADIGTSITHNMKHINVDLQKAGLRLLSLRQKPAVKLDLDGKVALRQGAGQRIWGSIYLRKLFFDQMNLYDTMPDALRGGARRNEQPLKDPVTMDGGVHFRMAGQHIRSHGDFGIKVPTFDVEDLKVAYKIHMDQRRNIIRIHKATVGSKSKHLSAKTHGKLAPRRVYDAAKRKYVTKAVPDIKAKVSLVSPKKGDGYSTFTVFRPPGGAPINIGGSIVLKAHVDDQNVSGSLDIRRFQFNDSGYTQVKNMNMHFPFALQLDYKKNISKLETGQAEVISNFHFSEKPNFTIESVSAKHPARDKSYTYMKDFQALMFVRDNTFELKKLQARVLDGQLIGKDTLFYLGNLDPKKMQYQLKLNLINIDMAALDQTLVKKQQEGGLLSAFVNLSGQDPAAADPRGYIIVNKIGPDIAKEVMEALNEKEGESKLGIAQPIVDRSTIPKSFEFRLGDGNIYTTVKFRRGAFSTVADLHPSELKYSRIPIQEFITGLQ